MIQLKTKTSKKFKSLKPLKAKLYFTCHNIKEYLKYFKLF